jgi:superfamily II DNA or RNA helicase
VRPPFLTSSRLLHGSWQAFERDIARLLVANSFDDVRIVGGTGDRGADVLGVKNGELWVVQCKFTSNSAPSPAAVDEVAEAARFYGGQRIFVATSRPAGPGTWHAIQRWKALGVTIGLLEPATLLEMAKRTPEYPAARRELRDYQSEAILQFQASLKETGRGQIVFATGLGKTVVMAETVAQLYRDLAVKNERTLILAGTRELVDQLERSFWTQLPNWMATHRLIGGEEPVDWDGVVFATVQSALSKIDELPEFGLVLIDEAHHIGADSFRHVLSRLSGAMVGGVTATPWRGDGYDIDTILGPPVVRIGIEEGLRRGFLCEADYRLYADNVDWDFVQQQSRNKYSIRQLNRLLLLPTRDEEAAKVIREIFDKERRSSCIAFCSTIIHARAFASMLKLFGFRAIAITGDMDARERDRVMVQFRQGLFDIVTTRDLFNEGVDVPNVDMIVFMRVTHSRRIFVQQLGRGLRVAPQKDKVVVLDFVSDLRRIAEVIELQRSVYGEIEHLPMPHRIIHFRDAGAGKFMTDWLKDQADLFDREGDAMLELPKFDFPAPYPSGTIQ